MPQASSLDLPFEQQPINEPGYMYMRVKNGTTKPNAKQVMGSDLVHRICEVKNSVS